MLKHRLISGSVVGALLLLTLFYLPPPALLVVLLIVSCFGQLEFYALANFGDIPVFRYFGLFSGAALITGTFMTTGPTPEAMATAYKWQAIIIMLSLMIVFVRQFPQKHNDKPLATIACTLLGIFYVPFLMNFFSHLALEWDEGGVFARNNPTGRLLVFYPILVTKFSDIGAYFTGITIGRNKLLPRISPGKTWEGLVGGTIASVIVSVVFLHFNGYHLGKVELNIVHAVVLGIVLALVGVVGDMFESLLKRASGLKDSSALIPGMGGVLDVVDSLLFAVPVFYAYLRVFA